MDIQKSAFIIVAFANIAVACMSQILGSMLDKRFDTLAFQLIAFPLVIILLNVVLGCKFRMRFYQYSLFAYLGLYVSIIFWGTIVLAESTTKELPPGEVVLGADLLFIIFETVVQSVIFLILNLITFVIYKFLFSKKLFYRS